MKPTARAGLQKSKDGKGRFQECKSDNDNHHDLAYQSAALPNKRHRPEPELNREKSDAQRTFFYFFIIFDLQD